MNKATAKTLCEIFLEDERASYPDTPGSKGTDTSAEAAEVVCPKVATLRADCLAMLMNRGPMTADECAGHIGVGILSIRPRFSELKRMGRISDTGERRSNYSGRRAIVWEPITRPPVQGDFFNRSRQ